MKLFGWTLERRSIENPTVGLGDSAAWDSFFGVTATSQAGELVTVDRALGVPAVWASVNFLSDTIADLPLKLYERTDDGSVVLTADPLHALLHDAPNPELTSFRWRKTAMTSVLTTGRAFAFIERAPSGRILNLWPLDPDLVSVERVNGKTRYKVEGSTAGGMPSAVYEASEVIDVPFMLHPDGVKHYSPVFMLRNAIGLAIALESYASRFFAGGGIPPLQLVGPFTSPEGASRAGQEIGRALTVARSAQRNVLPLPAGHELKSIGIDPEKSQMTDARRMQIEEIARIYGLPPHFIQDLTRATFSNIEQQSLGLVKHALGAWIKTWEQELNLKLFGGDRSRFVQFSLDGLLRGDFATRMSGYATSIQNGVRTPDEIRALEDLPPKGGAAAELHIQGATVPIERPEPEKVDAPVVQPPSAEPVTDQEDSDDEI